MSDSALATTFRTHLCGALRDEHVGASVRLGGWVHRARDLGGLVFFDLRDRAGLVQESVDLSGATPEVAQVASSLGAETVVLVEGTVVQRPVAMRNAELSIVRRDVARNGDATRPSCGALAYGVECEPCARVND